MTNNLIHLERCCTNRANLICVDIRFSLCSKLNFRSYKAINRSELMKLLFLCQVKDNSKWKETMQIRSLSPASRMIKNVNLQSLNLNLNWRANNHSNVTLFNASWRSCLFSATARDSRRFWALSWKATILVWEAKFLIVCE